MSNASKTIPDSTLDAGQVEDHLEVDTPIPGQQFVCLSFVSPEKVLPRKDAFLRVAFWKYLKDNHAAIDFAVLDNLEDLYATFIDQGGQDLEERFHVEHDFQTTVRGVKVRGVYSTMKEAEIRSKVLQKLDSHHHVFVAPVGYWLPWDPAADDVQDQVYQEEQLNELMKNYKSNEHKRDEYYAEQKDARIKQAAEETAALKKANAAEAAATAETLFEAVEDQTDHTSLKEGFDAFKDNGSA
jgi:hypothetical protein